jgi:hypothetical protein
MEVIMWWLRDIGAHGMLHEKSLWHMKHVYSFKTVIGLFYDRCNSLQNICRTGVGWEIA